MNEAISKFRESQRDYLEKERSKYTSLKNVIISYVKSHNLMISNMYMLQSDNSVLSYIDDFIDVYANNAMFHANAVINKLYETLPHDDAINYLLLATVAKNEEFAIMYDGRLIAKFKALQKTRSRANINLHDVIHPTFINSIPLLPADIEIIDSYSRVYNGDSDDTRDLFKQCIDNLSTRLQNKNKQKKGGVNIDSALIDEFLNEYKFISSTKIHGGAAVTCYERKRDELEALKLAIVTEWLPTRDDVALVGAYAVDLYTEGAKLCPKYDRIQLVGTCNSKQLRSAINEFLMKISGRYTINIGEALDLMIPKDFRTKREIFSITLPTQSGPKEKPLLEFFNSCEFELIPWRKIHNSHVAANDVIMRFLLIDVYILNFIYALGKLDMHSYKEKLTRYLQLLKRANEMPKEINGCLGVYYPFDIQRKELLLRSGEFFPPYVPANYYKKNNSLRSVQM